MACVLALAAPPQAGMGKSVWLPARSPWPEVGDHNYNSEDRGYSVWQHRKTVKERQQRSTTYHRSKRLILAV